MPERDPANERSDLGREATEIGIDVERIQEVLDEHPVRLAILFGSRVTGGVDARSDIDIAVEFESDEGERGELLLALLTDLSIELDRNDIDLSVVGDLAPRVGTAAFAHGVLLRGSPDRAAAHLERFEREVEGNESTRSLRDRLDETVERADRHVGRGT